MLRPYAIKNIILHYFTFDYNHKDISQLFYTFARL